MAGLIAATTAGAFVALLVRMRLGFGFSLVLVPLVTLAADFNLAFHLAVPLEVVVGLGLAYRHRRRLRLFDAVWMKACGIAGAAVGTPLRFLISIDVLVIGAMSLILVTCAAWMLRPPRLVRPSRGLLAIAGGTSGALNSWTSLSGPPVVLYYLATAESQDDVQGSLAGYFIVLYLATLIFMVVGGQYAHFHDVWPLVGCLGCVVTLWHPVARLADRIPGELLAPSLALIMIAAFSTGLRAAL